MVLKSNHRHIKKVTFQHNIADQTSLSLFSVKVYQFKPCNGSLICLIIFSKKLVTTADSNNYASIFHIFLKIRLNFLQLLTNQHLLPVGTTAQEHNIQSGKINLVLQFKSNGLCLNSTPLAASHKALDISSVSIQVQEIRI